MTNLRYKKASEEQATVVLVQDVSASISSTDLKPNRLICAIIAGRKFIEARSKVAPKDKVGVVTFCSTARTIYPPSELSKSPIAAINALNKAAIGDNRTNIQSGLSAANSDIECYTGMKEVVLFSDGVHNHGPDPVPFAEQMKRRGIIIYVIGIGAHGADHFNEDQLRQIASEDKYYPIETSSALIKLYEKIGGDRIVAYNDSDDKRNGKDSGRLTAF